MNDSCKTNKQDKPMSVVLLQLHIYLRVLSFGVLFPRVITEKLVPWPQCQFTTRAEFFRKRN
jgi:hypothetical protein